MKRLIFILLTSFPVLCYSQSELKLNLKTSADTLSYRIGYTNYCLNKFANENLIAVGAELIGAGILIYSSNDALNGIDDLYDQYQTKLALAGQSTEQRIIAERWYENELKDKQDQNKTLTIVGGAVMLGGGIIHIISYRWLKRAYIVPHKNGIVAGVKFNF